MLLASLSNDYTQPMETCGGCVVIIGYIRESSLMPTLEEDVWLTRLDCMLPKLLTATCHHAHMARRLSTMLL